MRGDAVADEERDAPGDDPSLARSGASDDEERRAAMGHGGALRVVQVAEGLVHCVSSGIFVPLPGRAILAGRFDARAAGFSPPDPPAAPAGDSR